MELAPPRRGPLTLTALGAEVFGLLVILYFFAHWGRREPFDLILKILPMVFLMTHLKLRGTGSRLQRWVMLGLGLSLVGDVLLAKAVDQFIPGLIAFLLAHLAYIRGLHLGGAPWHWPRLVPVALFGLGMAAALVPGLEPALGGAVSAYTVVICVMAWRALARIGQPGTAGAGWMAIGAGFFLASDSLLAWSRFQHEFRWDGELIMLSYWAAQLFLTAGAVRSQPQDA